MASITTDDNKNVRIQFTHPAGGRKTVYLGKVSQKVAAGVKLRVELLVGSLASGMAIDPQTAGWVKDLPDDTHEKIAAVGLVPGRPKAVTVAELLALYEADPDGDGGNKSSTVANHRPIGRHLLAFFKAATPVRAITPAAAAQFKAHVVARLGPGTIGRLLRHCRTVFKFAVKKGLAPANPFAEVSAPSPLDAERQAAYAEARDVEALIAAARPHMKVVLALARFGGLRCPSEALLLRWDEVYLDRDPAEMLVHAPKTEHHPGRETRLIPVFAALRPHLEAARRAAPLGAVYVVSGEWADRQRERAAAEGGPKNVNLSNQLVPVLKAAGRPGWPAPFVTFRASCRTDLHHVPGLTADTIARWMGHSAAVGSQHYHRVLSEEGRLAATAVAGKRDADSDARATQIPTRTGADRNGQDRTPSSETLEFRGPSPILSAPVFSGPIDCVTRRGVEPRPPV